MEFISKISCSLDPTTNSKTIITNFLKLFNQALRALIYLFIFEYNLPFSISLSVGFMGNITNLTFFVKNNLIG